jgi:hypothetical protein
MRPLATDEQGRVAFESSPGIAIASLTREHDAIQGAVCR